MVNFSLPAEATAVLFSASSQSFFSVNTITHEPLHWYKLCMNMYLDSLLKPIECQGYMSEVKVTWVLCVWYCLNQLAWIHEVLILCRNLLNGQTLRQRSHTLGSNIWCLSVIQRLATPRAVLSCEQGLTFLLVIFYTSFPGLGCRGWGERVWSNPMDPPPRLRAWYSSNVMRPSRQLYSRSTFWQILCVHLYVPFVARL